jgi:integrase
VNVKTISERIGHADINVTLSVYDHVFVQDDEAAASSIANHIYGAANVVSH